MSHATLHTHDTSTSAQIQQIVAEYQSLPGAMLPVLHAIQDRLGHIPESAIPMIAESLRHSRAEVHGIISFYHHFRTQPAGRSMVQVCRAEACQAVGGRQLEAHVKDRLGLDYHQTSLDHEFTLEPVYCLGNCACGPSIRVNDEIHGRMSNDKFDRLAEQLSAAVVEVK